MTNKLKKIPKFKNENEERLYWQAHDSTEHIDWKKAKLAKFTNLKASTMRNLGLKIRVLKCNGYMKLKSLRDRNFY